MVTAQQTGHGRPAQTGQLLAENETTMGLLSGVQGDCGLETRQNGVAWEMAVVRLLRRRGDRGVCRASRRGRTTSVCLSGREMAR